MTTPSTSDVLVPLTPLDAIMGHLGLWVVYVFPPMPSSASPFDLDRVRAAFVATIEEDYPRFVGEPHTDPKTGACFVRQTPATRAGGAAGIPFELDPHGALTTDEAVRTPPMSLLPARDHASELIKVKATLLCDGGLALGYNSSHALFDGQGLFTFMDVWGMHYRGLATHERLVVNHDLHLVMPRGVGFKMPHPEFVQPQAMQPETPAGVASKGGAVAPPEFPLTEQRPFHLTPTQLTTLKNAVSYDLPQGQYVSTVDVVTALFTVLITQARGHGQAVKITTGVNGRTRFSPPLPPNYAGNCIFNALSTYEASDLTSASAQTLQRVALRIRASVVQRDEAFMRDAIEFIAQDSGRWIEMRAGVEFFFGPDLMFTSWANMGMYKADFGSGSPVYAGPPLLQCDGMVIIMDAMNRATGLDVLPLLDAKVMARLTELWDACELLHP